MTPSRLASLAVAVSLGAAGLVTTPAVAKPLAESTTLITGDQVQVLNRPGKVPDVVIRPAPGRERMPFTKAVIDGTVSVLPFDALQLVNAGVLDMKLFDVTKKTDKVLIKYTDKPSIAGKDLKSINTLAVTIGNAQEFWHKINPQAPRQTDRLPGITKIVPDRKFRPLDQESVEQVKAPKAWQRGYTAKGVKVAVLDTGIDQEHPDLKGRIAATKDFTENEDVGDEVGHGTHVAGIIAGHGPQPGVAKDADLLIGRVCERSGCDESAIIAGMQWAAEQGAKVVNLSLGGEATDGTDELSQALNVLSAKHNVLFVVAAGNDGTPDSVSSPASADAALSVASVTKDGDLSYFSSRGPRTGDFAVKPEIAAPGYAIAAARAAGTGMGYPINERHTLASGTSMATPHVAGAAAILAGQHPDWSAARIKAALVNTAQPLKAKPFEVGTGLVNLDTATKTQLTAEPATLKLGTGTLTYRNDGATPVTIKLTLPDNVTADTTTITIPARSSKSVTVKATKPSNDAGIIIAKAGTTTIRTAVSTKTGTADQTRKLKVQTIDRHGGMNGTGGWGFLVVLVNHTNKKTYAGGLGNGRALEGEVPAGRYTVYAWVPSQIEGRPPWEPSQSLVAKEITLTENQNEVVLDARNGQKITATVNGQAGTGLIGTSFGATDRSAFASQGDEVYVVPAQTPGMVFTAVQFVRNVPGSSTCGQTDPCAIATGHENEIKAVTPQLTDADLAKVEIDADAPAGPGTGEQLTFAEHARSTAPSGDAAEGLKLPGRHTTYYHSTGDIGWDVTLMQSEPDRRVLQQQQRTTYANGKAYQEKWGYGVLGPSVATTMQRTGNVIRVNTPLLTDSTQGHVGWAGDFGGEGRVELYRDGKLVDGSSNPDGGVFQVPAGKSRYKLTATAAHDGPRSTRVEAVWEFASSESTGPLPLTAVRFDTRNGSHVPFQLERTASAGRTKKVQVDVSYDDGKSWQTGSFVLVGDRGVLKVKPGAVSLRTRVTDVNGNTGAQTIVRALT